MLLVAGLAGIFVMLVVFGIALGTMTAGDPPAVKQVVVATPRFFATQAAVDELAPLQNVPKELLLSQIERHIRLEEAVAESFLQQPDAKSLHARTTSVFLS